MIEELIKAEFLAMAQAAKSSKGKVYVQVASEVKYSLSPNEIDLPSHLVDGIISENKEKTQTY